MNSRNNIHLGLFLAGIILIVFGSIIIHPSFIPYGKCLIGWYSLLIIYIVAFGPTLFDYKDSNKTGHIIIGGAVYYKGFTLFTSMLAISFIALLIGIIGYSIAIFNMLGACVILCVYIYAGITSSSKVESVANEEKDKSARLNSIKSSMNLLAIQIETLDNRFDSIKKDIIDLNDSFRYLSPSDSRLAIEVEESILLTIRQIANSDLIRSGEDKNQEVNQLIVQLRTLYKQRKSIY